MVRQPDRSAFGLHIHHAISRKRKRAALRQRSRLAMGLRAATYADFQSAQSELQARGIAFEFRDHEIAHSIYLFDPDAYLLEITTWDVPKK
jgi:hypothetical protein